MRHGCAKHSRQDLGCPAARQPHLGCCPKTAAATAAASQTIATLHFIHTHVTQALHISADGTLATAPPHAAAAQQQPQRLRPVPELAAVDEGEAARLEELFCELERQGFGQAHVESAMSSVARSAAAAAPTLATPGGSLSQALTLEAALDWLLLHLAPAELPRRYAAQAASRRPTADAIDVKLRASELRPGAAAAASRDAGAAAEAAAEAARLAEERRAAAEREAEHAGQAAARREAEEAAERKRWILQQQMASDSSSAGSSSGDEVEVGRRGRSVGCFPVAFRSPSGGFLVAFRSLASSHSAAAARTPTDARPHPSPTGLRRFFAR